MGFPTSLVPHHCPFSISTSKAWRKEDETKPPRAGFGSSYFQVSVLVFQSLHRAPFKKEPVERRGSTLSSDRQWWPMGWRPLWRCLPFCTDTDGAQKACVCLGYTWTRGHGSTSMSQDPAALLLAAPSTARHGHQDTFWTGPWFSWLGNMNFGSMRWCVHHLVTCNMGWNQINSSLSMQLTHWPRQRHCLLSHPGEPCRFNTCVQSSLDCCLVLRSMKPKSQNLIETNILCLQGYILEKQDPNERLFHYIWVLLNRDKWFEHERENMNMTSHVCWHIF